ncbi:hypothetical protein K504DRAFT_110614 [Pleomassaria siparia CBS 279.74]|uniref:Uncharacterized protein n=1 Tax=Pleomassaria siparia CBS 279.74 TaxID=1314801 RepID=A0A6G1JW08_9PLEO|nr:hypothetical protein K504DRAFT_110614 [Pleomassaria siparia CBS 279.74]
MPRQIITHRASIRLIINKPPKRLGRQECPFSSPSIRHASCTVHRKSTTMYVHRNSHATTFTNTGPDLGVGQPKVPSADRFTLTSELQVISRESESTFLLKQHEELAITCVFVVPCVGVAQQDQSPTSKTLCTPPRKPNTFGHEGNTSRRDTWYVVRGTWYVVYGTW